jgi:hypothetical protein
VDGQFVVTSSIGAAAVLVALVTVGSPLRRVFGRLFPA